MRGVGGLGPTWGQVHFVQWGHTPLNYSMQLNYSKLMLGTCSLPLKSELQEVVG